MKTDTAQAVDFLKRFHPDGPWVLTCIDKDKKGIQTKTFYPAQEAEAKEWLDRYNGYRNCYFSVNPTIGPVDQKAEREDIKEVAYLHVDLDPRAGEDLGEERERILALLRKERAELPPPSVIVFSGGGYQGFWRLKDPIPINGQLKDAEDAKRYNIQIELMLGGDNTHNIDRIMRIPGTINLPDARKMKKGRTETLAEVVEFYDDRSYPIERFVKSPELQTSDTGFSSDSVRVSGNVSRLNDVDELGDNVPNRIKMIIVQGNDPDDPLKFGGSRSEWLFIVCLAMVQAGISDDVIFSVITDPNFRISESILDKKNSEKYALRQIERAKEEAIHPKLRDLNERHAVIGDIGGKCRVISEVFDPAMQRSRISRQSFEDFRNRYGHIKVELGQDPNGKPIRAKLGAWWLEHPMHRHYETISFSPGKEVPGTYNLWKGFACEALPGDCSLFLGHIRDNICSGNEEWFQYMLGWMARGVQKPDEAGQVAVVLRGRMGTGKSIFARAYGALFGRHFLQVSDPKHLVGSFNSHLRDCVVLFGDEAFWAGDKKHEGTLKTLITEPYITFEAKGVDAETGPNYTHIILASNSTWVVPAGSDERRYFMLDVGDAQMQNSDYFRAIQQQLDNGGREALLHMLMTRDLSEFNVRDFPRTQALQDQKLLSMSNEDEWWLNILEEGRLLTTQDRWTGEVEKEELYRAFYSYMKDLGCQRRATKISLQRFLSRMCGNSHYPLTRQKLAMKSVQDDYGHETKALERPYYWVFPSLQECRAIWERTNGRREWMEIDVSEAQLDLIDQGMDRIPF